MWGRAAFSACAYGSLLLLGTAPMALTAYAQEAGQEPAPESAAPESVAEADALQLPPITVTAQKRTQTLSDVPISMSVVEGDPPAGANLDPLLSLAREVPNFSFIDQGSPGGSYLIIRGVGPLGGPLNNLDSSVALNVDGVPTSITGIDNQLLDVRRIEVLRGPQSTLYGRSALGGVINIINTPADGTPELKVSGELGDPEYAQAEIVGGGWIVPGKVAGRFAGRFNTFGGDIENIVSGDDTNKVQNWVGRGTLTFTPNDRATITAVGSYEDNQREYPTYILRDDRDFPRTALDDDPQQDRDAWSVSLNVSYDITDRLTVTSITGYQDIDTTIHTDDTNALLYARATGLPMELFLDDGDRNFSLYKDDDNILSQELRLNGETRGGWDWVTGLSYIYSDYTLTRDNANDFIPLQNGVVTNEIKSQTVGLFGDLTVPITEKLSVSGGARVAYDHQKFEGDFVSNGYPGIVPAFQSDDSFDDTYVTGRLAAQYTFNDNATVYASVSRGYASGGFDKYNINAPLGQATGTFDSSTAWNYEIGTRLSFLDNRIDLDLSAFYMDVKDGILSSFDPNTNLYGAQNQDYRSYGIEAESRVLVTENLLLRGNLGLIKAELRDVDPNNTNGLRGSNDVPNVPEISGGIGVEHYLPLSGIGAMGDIVSRASVTYVGEREADPANNFTLDDYALVDLQVGWENPSFSVYGFARNVFDERYEVAGAYFGPGAETVLVGRGRVLGIGASFKF